MTAPLPAQVPVTTHDGDGATLAFLIGFTLRAPSTLTVTVDGVTKTAGVDYSVLDDEVVFTVAPADGAAIVFERVTPIRQERAFPNQPTVTPRAIEQGFTERATVEQELAAGLSRTLRTPPGEAGS